MPRYVVVGGAGSLDDGNGVKLIDAGGVPEPYGQNHRTAGCNFLDTLRQTSDLDWTFLSPSAQFVPGERTGVFKSEQTPPCAMPAGKLISYETTLSLWSTRSSSRAIFRRQFTVGY